MQEEHVTVYFQLNAASLPVLVFPISKLKHSFQFPIFSSRSSLAIPAMKDPLCHRNQRS